MEGETCKNGRGGFRVVQSYADEPGDMTKQMEELIDMLLAGTRTGIFAWSNTNNMYGTGSYKLTLNTGTVRIYRMGRNGSVIGCVVLNEENNELEEVQVERGGPLSVLYELMSSGFDKSMEDIVAELRTLIGAHNQKELS